MSPPAYDVPRGWPKLNSQGGNNRQQKSIVRARIYECSLELAGLPIGAEDAPPIYYTQARPDDDFDAVDAADPAAMFAALITPA